MPTGKKPDRTREAVKTLLSQLVERVLADGVVEDSERAALQKVLQRKALTAADVREVLETFLESLKLDVIAGGAVTPLERKRCQAVVDQLKIPLRLLPPEILEVVLGKKP